MDIQRKLINYNFSSRGDSSIQYIVIHDTGNTRAGAHADAHYRYFGGGNRNASAHYFVDDKSIIQIVDDSKAAWHCGDGKGKYGITNANSLGVEMCINSDGDFIITLLQTIALVKDLMKKHNIPVNRVVRHYNASQKICPKILSGNSWERWYHFLNVI